MTTSSRLEATEMGGTLANVVRAQARGGRPMITVGHEGQAVSRWRSVGSRAGHRNA